MQRFSKISTRFVKDFQKVCKDFLSFFLRTPHGFFERAPWVFRKSSNGCEIFSKVFVDFQRFLRFFDFAEVFGLSRPPQARFSRSQIHFGPTIPDVSDMSHPPRPLAYERVDPKQNLRNPNPREGVIPTLPLSTAPSRSSCLPALEVYQLDLEVFQLKSEVYQLKSEVI